VTATLGYSASQSKNFPDNTSSTTATNPYTGSSGIASGTASVGSSTADGILVQNPTASVTAGVPWATVTGAWSTGVQTWPDGTSRQTHTVSAKTAIAAWSGYLGGSTQAAADKAGLTYQAAQLTAQVSRNKTVLAVKQAFYTMLSAQENLTLLTTTLESRKTTLKFVETKMTLRQALETDLLTAQVNERSAELDLVDGQNALTAARARLANLMGLATDAAFTTDPEADPEPPAANLEDAVATGLRTRSELQIADLNARSAQVDRNLALGSATPTVSLTAGVTGLVDPAANRSVVVGQVGVTVGTPLWDAGQSGGSMAQAEKVQAGYLTQIHQLTRSIPVDIREGWNAWTQAQQRYDLAQLNAKNYDQQLRIVRAQVDAGSKTLADQFTAEVNASTAAFGLLKAKITAQLAVLQLQNLLGL
jgi:outer membrane protein TolC